MSQQKNTRRKVKQRSLFDAPPPTPPPPADGGKPVLDLAEGRRRRDRGMEIVDKSTDFQYAADRAVAQAARVYSAFTVDVVWQFVDGEYGVDKRAMGPAMMRARLAKLIAPSADFRPTSQPKGHATPRRIWISQIHQAPRGLTG
jgi:hypothetical protein